MTITLNVNGLNAPTKRHRLAKWIPKKKNKTKKTKKNNLIYMCLQETYFRSRDTYR